MENGPVTGIVKILLGTIIGGVILYKAPLMELLTGFFYFVFIPLALLSSLGLIGTGTVDLMGGTFNQFQSQLRERVKAHRDNLAKTPEPPPAVPPTASPVT